MKCNRCLEEIENDFCFEVGGTDGGFLQAYCYPCFKLIKETSPFMVKAVK